MSLSLAPDAYLSWSLPSVIEQQVSPHRFPMQYWLKNHWPDQAFFEHSPHTNSISNSAILRNNYISLLSDLCACVHVKKKWRRKGTHSSSVSGSVQFSSFWFDNPGNAASPIDRRFSCRSWAPLVGDGDDITTELAWVTINGIAQTCISGRAKGKFLFLRRTTLQQKKNKGFSGIRAQGRAWARHWRLSLYQYTTATYRSNRLMWLQNWKKAMSWCTAQRNTLLFCAKTVMKTVTQIWTSPSEEDEEEERKTFWPSGDFLVRYFPNGF